MNEERIYPLKFEKCEMENLKQTNKIQYGFKVIIFENNKVIAWD